MGREIFLPFYIFIQGHLLPIHTVWELVLATSELRVHDGDQRCGIFLKVKGGGLLSGEASAQWGHFSRGPWSPLLESEGVGRGF